MDWTVVSKYCKQIKWEDQIGLHEIYRNFNVIKTKLTKINSEVFGFQFSITAFYFLFYLKQLRYLIFTNYAFTFQNSWDTNPNGVFENDITKKKQLDFVYLSHKNSNEEY